MHKPKWGRGISAAITGAWLFFLEENSGEVVAAYLLPHHLFMYVILYMNIIEFIHVAIRITTTSLNGHPLNHERRFFHSSFEVYPVAVVQDPFLPNN